MLFIEYNMPADFIDDMTANANSLEQHMSLQTEGTGTGVNTNASIEEALQHVNELIDRLEVIVRNKFRDDPAKFAAWESARHMEHAARTKRGGGNTPTPQTNN